MDRPVTGADGADGADGAERSGRSGEGGAASLTLRSGAPGLALAVIAPLAAIALVGFRVATEGLAAGPEDPVPPVVLAVATVVAGLVLGWRGATQRADLDPSGIRCRNLVVGFEVDWDLVDSVVVHRRGPVQLVELHLSHLRRHHRLGAATRFAGGDAEALAGRLAAHPRVAERLVVDEPDRPTP